MATRLAPNPRTYQQALALLAKLQSNTEVRAALAAKPELNAQSRTETVTWLRRAGHARSDLGRLRCIHVAGTKGKGSVCAYTASILREYFWVKDRRAARTSATGTSAAPGAAHRPDAEPTHGADDGAVASGANLRPLRRRVGIYTSPHLVSVRERIAIDGEPISRDLFTRYFFEVWDAMGASLRVEDTSAQPGYFRFLTILAFHVFLREGVRDAVIECGIGGEHDPTNVLPAQAVSVAVVTRIGFDHTELLGRTRPEIAWQKAGIFKPGAVAVTVHMPKVDPDLALELQIMALTGNVIRRRAKENGVGKLVMIGWKAARALNGWLAPTTVPRSAPARVPAATVPAAMVPATAPEATEPAAVPAVTVPATTPATASGIDAGHDDDLSADLSRGKMNGEFQAENRALAAAAAMSHLGIAFSPYVQFATGIPRFVVRGILKARLRGRCELIRRPDVDWILDGAHTCASVHSAARTVWELVPELAARNRILVFNQQARDVADLLRYTCAGLQKVSPTQAGDLSADNYTSGGKRMSRHGDHESKRRKETRSSSAAASAPALKGPAFHHAIFTTNDMQPVGRGPGGMRLEQRVLTDQHVMAGCMNALDRRTSTGVLSNVEQTMQRVDHLAEMAQRETGRRTVALVVGSFHLVGAFLRGLEPKTFED